ncbi:hypothetical protein JXI42_14260 [bacterium]|nr:hypothetical protein [bacterium]
MVNKNRGGKYMCEDQKDKYLWLENIDGESALEWVKNRNNATVETLQKHPDYQRINAKILQILRLLLVLGVKKITNI